MEEKKNSALVLFIRYPEIGKVKTRLSRDLGEEKTKELYENFVKDILSSMESINADIKIFLDPAGLEDQFRQLFGVNYLVYPQKGVDMGSRMERAFKLLIEEGYEKIVIIGYDVPDLPAVLVNNSFSLLDSHGAVIGPSEDGGYYLLGLKKDIFSPALFRDIPWSTSRVYLKTIKKLEKEGISFQSLKKWRDVDRFGDLFYFIERNRGNKNVINSIKFLKNIGMA